MGNFKKDKRPPIKHLVQAEHYLKRHVLCSFHLLPEQSEFVKRKGNSFWIRAMIKEFMRKEAEESGEPPRLPKGMKIGYSTIIDPPGY